MYSSCVLFFLSRENLRSEAGCIIDNQYSDRASELDKEFLVKTIESKEYITAEFPYKGQLSVLLGIIKVYPVLEKDNNPADVIAAEKARRQLLFNALLSSGPSYSSSNYGALQFIEGNSFIWTGYSLLSPSVIPSGAGSRGKVDLKYFLGKELSFIYDGIISLSFDSRDDEICFFYKLEETGLRLEHLPFSFITNNTCCQKVLKVHKLE